MNVSAGAKRLLLGVMVTSLPYLLKSSSVAVDRIEREDPLAYPMIGTAEPSTLAREEDR